MFIVNGNVNSWTITRDEESNSFTVQNRGDVSFTVRDADLSKLVEPTADGKPFVDADIYPDEGLVVRYDEKTMMPVGYGSNRRKDTMIAAVSINVKRGYHITSVYNNGAMIYSAAFDKERFVDFIGNFSESRGQRKFYPSVKVVAVNDDTKEICTYYVAYSQKRETVTVKLSRTDMDHNPAKGEKGHVNTYDFVQKSLDAGRPILPLFFPASPTNVILVEAGFRDKLMDMLYASRRWKGSSKYDIREYTDNAVIDDVYNEGYYGVTFYLDLSFKGKDFVKYFPDWKTEHPEVAYAAEKFGLVYIIGQNGGLFKLKVNGELRG